MDVKPDVDIPTQVSDVPTHADVPNKQETYSMGAWGDISSDEEPEENSREYCEDTCEEKDTLASRHKYQEAGVPRWDVVSPLQVGVPSVQEVFTSMTSIVDVHKVAAPNIPKKIFWVWIPKKN